MKRAYRPVGKASRNQTELFHRLPALQTQLRSEPLTLTFARALRPAKRTAQSLHRSSSGSALRSNQSILRYPNCSCR
jgi:hypothetical protein